MKDLSAAQPDRSWKGRVIYTPGAVSGRYDAIAASVDRPLAILTSDPSNPRKYVDWSRIGSLPANESNQYRCSRCCTATDARSKPQRR